MSELASFRAAIEDLWWYCRLFRHDRTRDDRRRAERVSRALDERGYELFSFCRRRMLGARPVPDRLVRNTFAAFYASWLKSHVGRPKQHARSYIVMPRWRLEGALPSWRMADLPGVAYLRDRRGVHRRGIARRRIVLPVDAAAIVDRALAQGLLDRSTFGEIRIDADHAAAVCAEFQIEPGRDPLAAIEAACRRARRPPRTTLADARRRVLGARADDPIRGLDVQLSPSTPKPRRREPAPTSAWDAQARREARAELRQKYGEDASSYILVDRRWENAQSRPERREGCAYTDVPELAEKSGLTMAQIRALLPPGFGEQIALTDTRTPDGRPKPEWAEFWQRVSDDIKARRSSAREII